MTVPRPEMSIASAELLPHPYNYCATWFRTTKTQSDETNKALRYYGKVDGNINRILSRFFGSPQLQPEKAFLLAEANTAKRNNQILLTAMIAAEGVQLPSLIVVPREEFSYMRSFRDRVIPAEHHANIPIISYDLLERYVEHAERNGMRFGMAAFFEAHLIAQQRCFNETRRLPAQYRLYATPTPFVDKAGTLFFFSELQNRPIPKVLSSLVPMGSEWQHPGLISNIRKSCEDLMAEGAMLQRETPFWGEIKLAHCALNPREYEHQNWVYDHFERRINATGEEGEVAYLTQRRNTRLIHLTHRSKTVRAVTLIEEELDKGNKVVVFGTDWSPGKGFLPGRALAKGFIHDLSRELKLKHIIHGVMESFLGVTTLPNRERREEQKRIHQQNHHVASAFQGKLDPAQAHGLEPKVNCDVILIPSSLTNLTFPLHAREGEKPRSIIDASMLRGDALVQRAQLVSQDTAKPSRYIVLACDNGIFDATVFTPHALGDLLYLQATGSACAEQFQPVIETAVFENRHLMAMIRQAIEDPRPSRTPLREGQFRSLMSFALPSIQHHAGSPAF